VVDAFRQTSLWFDHFVAIVAEHLFEGKSWFRQSTWCRERQWLNGVLSIQLIDFPIRRIIGWMTRAELGGIWSRLRLTKDRVSNNSIIA
jgi:hypothetical protein